MSARGLVVAAPRSGGGKTLATLAILLGMRRRGLRARAFKSGPDYIDPGFHALATGAPCANLDSWAMPPALLDNILATGAGADFVAIESAMGLFDGADAPEPDRRGSAADLARRHRLPVLLVLDVSGQSQSAAAVARGFASHDPGVRVAGVVLNRLGSERHREQAARAITTAGLPVLGGLFRDPALALPERHLGLVQAEEQSALPALFARLAELAEAALDLDGILAAARSLPGAADAAPVRALPPPGQRIALARDAAFSFVYPHLLEGWRARGAEIAPFSPLADEAPPAGCDACWLPGGYPELHAPRLAGARRFLDGLAAFARHRPVHGECGGYMVLGAGLQDASGDWHRMAELLGHRTSFAARRMRLGYRRARLLADCCLGPAGAAVRGHEFHYAATVDPGDDPPLASLHDATGRDLGPAGGRRGRVSGSFFHAIAPEDS